MQHRSGFIVSGPWSGPLLRCGRVCLMGRIIRSLEMARMRRSCAMSRKRRSCRRTRRKSILGDKEEEELSDGEEEVEELGNSKEEEQQSGQQ